MKFAAKLLLENGISFEGIGFGFQKIGVGEVVFNTAFTVYQEILTDPSYDGQIITFTYPHIGNTGINFCLLYTSPSPRDGLLSRMPSSA